MSVAAFMASVADPKLSPTQDQQSGLLGTGTAGVTVQNYVNTILAQEDLVLDFPLNLPKHQQAARENAIYWRDKLQPKVYSTISDIIDFGNQYQSFYDPLVSLAHRLQEDSDNQEAKNTLKQGYSYFARYLR